MISKINSFSPAFGVIRDGAIIRAKASAKGDRNELAKINKLIKEQQLNKDNDIDYVEVFNPFIADNIYGYGVIRLRDNCLLYHSSLLQAACAYSGVSNHPECGIDGYRIVPPDEKIVVNCANILKSRNGGDI